MLFLYFVTAVLSIGNVVDYLLLKPEREPAFSQSRAKEQLWRRIIFPSFLSLVMGFMLNAFLPNFFTDPSEGNSGGGFINYLLFLGILATFFVMLSRIVRHDPDLVEFANTPQRIMASAQELRGESPGAEDNVARLRCNLDRWKENSGAASMGWAKKKSSASLNEALRSVPAHRKLNSAAVWRSARRTEVYAAAWRTAPLRFGWPAYVIGVLNLALICVGPMVATSWLPWACFVLISVAVSLFFIAAYQVSLLLFGTRRFSRHRFYEQYCESELVDAQQRVDEHKTQILRERLVPLKIDEIQISLRQTRAALVAGQVAVIGAVIATPIARRALRADRPRR
jgi:hypothetical protein